jgi:hypothetical protein
MALANCRAIIFISVTASLSKICGKAQRRHHLFMPSQYLLAAESHAPRCPVACAPVAQRSKAGGRTDRSRRCHAALDTPALRVGTSKAVAVASPTTRTAPFNMPSKTLRPPRTNVVRVSFAKWRNASWASKGRWRASCWWPAACWRDCPRARSRCPPRRSCTLAPGGPHARRPVV